MRISQLVGSLLVVATLVSGISMPVEVQAQSVDASSLSCDRTIAQFKATGEITCGHFAWDLHPQDAAAITDPMAFFLSYERYYESLRGFTGYEPRVVPIKMIERCAHGFTGDATTSCPNGALAWPYPAYRLGDSMEFNHIFGKDLVFTANHPDHPLFMSIAHEMGHMFSPLESPYDPLSMGYLWDHGLVEGWGDLIGPIQSIMRAESAGQRQSFYWDAFCWKKGLSSPCDRFLTSIDDYMSVDYDPIWQEYLSTPLDFEKVFPYPIDTSKPPYIQAARFGAQIVAIYKDFKAQGRGADFYRAMSNVLRYYHSNVSRFPASWRVPVEDQTRDTIVAKANTFVFLLSSYTETDLTDQFQKWGWPIMRATKDQVGAVARAGYTTTALNGALATLVGTPMKGGILAARVTGLAVTSSATVNTSAVTLTWNAPVNTAFTTFYVYRSSGTSSIRTFLGSVSATTAATRRYVDSDLTPGMSYRYSVVAVNSAQEDAPESLTVVVSAPALLAPPVQTQTQSTTQQNQSQTQSTTQQTQQSTTTQQQTQVQTPVPAFLSHGFRNVSQNEATVYWLASVPIRVELFAGAKGTGIRSIVTTTQALTGGSVALSGLIPGTSYEYRLEGRATTGHLIVAQGTFVTAGIAPSTSSQQNQSQNSQPSTTTSQAISGAQVGTTPRPVPPTPQGVRFEETGTSNSVMVLWEPKYDVPYQLIKIYRSASPDEQGTYLTDLPSGVVWYDNSLTPGGEYFYRFVGVTRDGYTSNALVARARISPYPTMGPQGLRVSSSDVRSITLAWTIPSYYTSARTVVLYRSTTPNDRGQKIAENLRGGTYVDRFDRKANTRYYYTAHIVNSAGFESVNENRLGVQIR